MQASSPHVPDARKLQEIYSRTAAFYDEVAAGHQAAAKDIAIEMLARTPGERFLEVAFGTGWVLVRLLKQTGWHNAYGLEIAPGMLDVARQRLASALPSLPGLLLGDCARLPFANESFDCILCTYLLECMDAGAISRTLSELRRVLRADGRLVIADLTEGEGDDAAIMEEWKAGYVRDPEFYGGARPLELRPLVGSAGLVVEERRYSGHGAGWPAEIIRATKGAVRDKEWGRLPAEPPRPHSLY
jgi:ubiquinone/menaquinone biosynthesis C-methylase UbiE